MRSPLAILIIISTLVPCFSQTGYSCLKVKQFKQLLDEHHVETRPWDDAFARATIDQFFYLIDPSALYFSEDEKMSFENNADKSMEALVQGNCTSVATLLDRYKAALIRADNIIDKISLAPITFDKPDTVTFAFYGEAFVPLKELELRWLKQLKFQCLADMRSASSAKDLAAQFKKVCSREKNVIKRKQQQVDERFIFNTFMNAIATVYDPHTAYFAPEKKYDFLDMVSSESHSFGVTFTEDPLGHVTIGRIIPGSSAWNSGKVHVGDVVMEIAGPHTEKTDVSLLTIDEFEETFESISQEVQLSLKKVNGEEVTVTLVKQKLREDDNMIKSVVLSDAQNKFGYINLPVFFSKDEATKSGCANELAKEIIQLKKAGVEGIVLDIRDNGGGNLSEAIDLVGIFIDRGAVGILKERGKEPETLKDSNLGTVYDGPLLVMINGGSASASELFAAAMRDHNRALLVGTHTYGKGTGQSLMPFTGKDGDMTTITSFRFYSASGQSHQGYGVKPDIVLPDVFAMFNYRENSERHFLKPEKVVKKTYYTPLAPLPLDVLRDSSATRLKKSKYFSDLLHTSDLLSKYVNEQEIRFPLTLNGFTHMHQLLEIQTEVQTPVADRYKISLTKVNAQINAIDEYGNKTFEFLMDDIGKDHYILESLTILTNYLSVKK